MAIRIPDKQKTIDELTVLEDQIDGLITLTHRLAHEYGRALTEKQYDTLVRTVSDHLAEAADALSLEILADLVEDI